MPDIYNHYDRLTPGSEAELKRTVYYRPATDNIAPFIELNPAELERRIGKSEYRERELYDKARAILDEWGEQAGETLILRKASEYQQTKLPEHTGNQWVETKEWVTERKISNLTYKFYVYLYENSKYERDVNGNSRKVITGYDVTWSFSVQDIGKLYSEEIDGQIRKHYKDLESAEKYLAGRFKKYSGYFKEIQPKIKPEHADHFKVGGVLLPGYEVETEES